MAVLVPVGSAYLAFGLEWRRLTGLDKHSRAIKPAAETAGYATEILGGASLFVKARHADKGPTVVGLLPNNALRGALGTKKIKVYSAAHVFLASITETNAAVLVTMEDGRYAFIGIRDRLPAVGYDIVGTAEEVTTVGRQFISRIKQTGVSFYFVGKPGPDLDVTHFHPNSSLPDLFTKNVERSDALLVPLQQRNLVLPLVVVIGAILAGGYVVQEQREREEAEARLRAIKAAPVVKPKDPAQQYIASVHTALSATFVRASTAAGAYLAVAGPLPEVATDGWKFSEVNCTAGACQVTWARLDKARATNASLSSARGGQVHFLTDLKSAQERLDVPGMPDGIPDLSALPKAQEFLVTTGSRFQVMKRAGLSVTLTSGGGGNTLELAGKWPEGSTPPADTLLIRTGTWEIKGDYALRSALRELPDNMSLSLLNVQAKGGGAGTSVATTTAARQQPQIEFTASGSFYVR